VHHFGDRPVAPEKDKDSFRKGVRLYQIVEEKERIQRGHKEKKKKERRGKWTKESLSQPDPGSRPTALRQGETTRRRPIHKLTGSGQSVRRALMASM